MTEQRNRGSAGGRPALVIDGEATVVARHPRRKPASDPGRTETKRPPAAEAPRAHFGRAAPGPARRRPAPAADLFFQPAPRQPFAVPSAPTARSVLPAAAWIAGIAALAVLVPLAALSVRGMDARPVAAVPGATLAALPAAEKPVRILYGTQGKAPTRLALSGYSRPAMLPGSLGSVYPVSAGSHPAGVARLGPVTNVRDMKAAVRRTIAE